MISALFALCSALAPGASVQDSVPPSEPFPASSAMAEGVSPQALDALSELIVSLVADEEIVGAELLVIKNGRSILHEAYGWSDLEAQVPLETGSVFCVRSMTKPLIGTAILMLIEDGLLDLDDPVAKYLPSFDVEGSREITIEHLITHTSGLPMSLLLGQDLDTLHAAGGIRAVADLGGGHELDFEPGGNFQYSDQGTDTLTALVEVVTGAPAADFVEARILDPLGMEGSACVMSAGHALRERALPAYAGARGSWTRFWSPDEAALFPFFLGSQGLYSTLEDYARFMTLWDDRGRVGRERLLSSRHVRTALTPGAHPMGGPTGLPGLRADYGYLMQLWTDGAPDGEAAGGEEPGKPGRRELVAFGHTGSDGTHAWVFPEQNAMVLYFTQSRGSSTGLRVEEVLGELFLGVPFDPNQAAPPFEEYLGYYWEGGNDLHRAIIRDGEDLALEILGKGVVPLTYVGEDRWKLRPNPSKVLAFDRSEAGVVTGYHVGDHQEFRFEPSADLPSADEVEARVTATHRIDLLETLGPLRLTGELTIESLEITGQTTSLMAWPDRVRYDVQAGEQYEHVVLVGDQVEYSSPLQAPGPLTGPRADAMRIDHPFARLGDWGRWYPSARVIQRLEGGDDVILVVRMGDLSAPGTTLYIDDRTGRVGQQDSVVIVEGMGRIGQRAQFRDFREVSGMLLPFEVGVRLANPLIGEIVTKVTDFELGVELTEQSFELGE